MADEREIEAVKAELHAIFRDYGANLARLNPYDFDVVASRLVRVRGVRDDDPTVPWQQWNDEVNTRIALQIELADARAEIKRLRSSQDEDHKAGTEAAYMRDDVEGEDISTTLDSVVHNEIAERERRRINALIPFADYVHHLEARLLSTEKLVEQAWRALYKLKTGKPQAAEEILVEVLDEFTDETPEEKRR